MKPLIRKTVPTLVAFVFLGMAVSAIEAQEPSGFLLRYRYQIIMLDPPFETTVDQLIFRDGSIVVAVDNPIPPPGVFQYERKKVSPAMMKDLYSEIRRGRISLQTGNCRAVNAGFDENRETISLFATGPHGHTFNTGSKQSEACPEELTRFIFFISDWLFGAPLVDGLGKVTIKR
jgi:hypothetical protein